MLDCLRIGGGGDGDGDGAKTIFCKSAYLYEHGIEDKNHVYDLSGHDKDVEATGWLVQPHSVQIAGQLERSYRTSRSGEKVQAPTGISPLTKTERCNPTYSRSLQQERNDAEEVDVRVINCELHKDRSGVAIQPFVPEEMLKGSGKNQ